MMIALFCLTDLLNGSHANNNNNNNNNNNDDDDHLQELQQY